MKSINVIGGGLAGCEACNYLLNHGFHVNLYEKRPKYSSPAHHTGLLAELVCSNSLKSNEFDNACGLLKEEMRQMYSITMESASLSRIESGTSLSVDRDLFSKYIHEKLLKNPNINIIEEDVSSIPNGITIITTGPLTSEGLLNEIIRLTGEGNLFFFDASAPIIKKESIDFNYAFSKTRYSSDGSGYIDCPLNRSEYYNFVNELNNAKRALVHDFDKNYFEGCMPIEVMSSRGIDTLRFGPLSPKGLIDDNGQKPFAVVQLRQDNLFGDLYNMVGFQTNLTYSEQKRVFALIPALKNAEYVRYGLMHRNSYILAPKVLNSTLNLKINQNVFIAGQLCGVEGYVESAATGIIAAINAAHLANNETLSTPPLATIIGSLLNYISNSNPLSFSPMNANYSIYYNKDHLNKNDIAIKSISAIKDWYIKNE
jgi:methylenetetrahydrofolate--tRNA-(uracil-5-)-methyltransferase